MLKRLSSLAAVLGAVLMGLTACGKNPAATTPDSAPPGYTGSKSGPPAGLPGQQPGQNPGQTTGQTPGQTPNPNQQNPAGLPTPPTTPLFNIVNPQARDGSLSNLKNIALAFHNLHDQVGALPVGFADKSGKLGLSWRVAILPYIEQDALYRQFKLDEPWNSEHNLKLVASMPAIYAPPRATTNGYTFYRSFSGGGAVMPAMPQGKPGQLILGTRITSITDGTSNTFLVAEAAAPVIWTKPDDLTFTPGDPPKLGGGVFNNGFCVALCDGTSRFLNNIDDKTLSNLIQTNDGNIVMLP